jgi:hypothetical protein
VLNLQYSSTSQYHEYVWKLAKTELRREQKITSCGVCALVWALGCDCSSFTGYSYGYLLDPQVVLSSPGGAASGLWILRAAVCSRFIGLPTTRVIGGFLDDYMMHRQLVFLFFRWLIFMYTLSDP